MKEERLRPCECGGLFVCDGRSESRGPIDCVYWQASKLKTNVERSSLWLRQVHDIPGSYGHRVQRKILQSSLETAKQVR